MELSFKRAKLDQR